VWCSVVCLAAALFLTPVLAFVPTPVLAGLLIFLGLSMMREWLLDSFVRLPLGEYLLVLGITLVIVFDGLIAGVAVGMLAAACLFVYHCSRTETVRHVLSTETFGSNREHSVKETLLLRQFGDAARALCLQGYIFFGTSSEIVRRCREFIGLHGTRYLILDFRLVQGVDVSASAAFQKLARICAGAHARLLFSSLQPDVERLFRRDGLLDRFDTRVFPDLDRSLEWVEEQLLAELRLSPEWQPDDSQREAAGPFQPSSIDELLAQHFRQDSIKDLREYWEAEHLAPGQALFKQGDPGRELYLVVQGQVSVWLRTAGAPPTRLRTYNPGTVVGEMALYTSLTRSADVIADSDSLVWKLPAGNLARMERADPELAIQFHNFIVKLLAGRLAAADQQISALS